MQKDNEKFCRPMISCKAKTKILYKNLIKAFSSAKKMASRNIFQHFFHTNFFIFVLLISNCTVFLVQFQINLHLWVFQKAEIALADAAHAIPAFWKTHLCKLIPNWTRNCMITYTNIVRCTYVMYDVTRRYIQFVLYPSFTLLVFCHDLDLILLRAL